MPPLLWCELPQPMAATVAITIAARPPVALQAHMGADSERSVRMFSSSWFKGSQPGGNGPCKEITSLHPASRQKPASQYNVACARMPLVPASGDGCPRADAGDHLSRATLVPW